MPGFGASVIRDSGSRQLRQAGSSRALGCKDATTLDSHSSSGRRFGYEIPAWGLRAFPVSVFPDFMVSGILDFGTFEFPHSPAARLVITRALASASRWPLWRRIPGLGL
jgi:hypothetical protein